MRRFFMMLAMGLYASSAFAADPAPAAVSVPTPALPTSVPTAPAPAPAVVPQPITAELNDGSKVVIEVDGSVSVLGADGSKTLAPDGTMTLKDGTPFIVKDGKRVDE